MPLLQKFPTTPVGHGDDMGGGQPPSMDLSNILAAVLRRWKVVTFMTLASFIVTMMAVKLVVPPRYKSTVEILVYDPQRQIDATFQKPISPFVDAIGFEAINTEIYILKSKSVAMRVATELGLDTDSEFQSGGLQVSDLAKRLKVENLAKLVGIEDLINRFGIADFVERLRAAGKRLGLGGVGSASNDNGVTVSAADEKADKLDRAADQLINRLEIWPESYIIFVSATARDPLKAQRLASTVANEYLASQREARQEALDRAAAWLKTRMDNLQSRMLTNEALIERLKNESGLRDIELDAVKEQQIRDLETQLSLSRQEVKDKGAHLEQAHRVVDTHGDIDTIPEMTAWGPLAELHQKKMQLNLSLADLQNRLGEHSPPLVSIRAQIAEVDKQMDAEAGKILVIMKNAYDLAVRRQQSLEANLNSLAANRSSESFNKWQQLRHAVDQDRKDYEVYLTQYNDTSERRETEFASARIISPATLPRSPTSSRIKFYAIGGIAGLGGSLLLAFLLEYMKPGLRTRSEVEQSFGLPVVGLVPLVGKRRKRDRLTYQPLLDKVNEPFSHLNEAVQSVRVGLELSSANAKVILITSALPGEGKSTAAMLLAASSAGSGRRAILVDCDLRRGSSSLALRRKPSAGLSEFLRGRAQVSDILSEDPATKFSMISAGSTTPNPADLLMSQQMRDLISTLRHSFDYVVMDGPPLLHVVDALPLATLADKILVIAEWGRTPRASLAEALKALSPEADRVAGVVLNKVNFVELPRYDESYRYRSVSHCYSDG
jgi:polysaccharide biosynthesis transport protein